jgi:hypothetical protein
MQCLGMATPLSKNESNKWSSDDTHRASFMYCSRTHSQVAQIKNGIVLTQNSLSTTHAWQYREVENDEDLRESSFFFEKLENLAKIE